MGTQKARFTPPTRGSAGREREVTFGVAGGVHFGVPSQSVPNGFSPTLRNLVPSGAGAVTPRSALTKVSSGLISGINAPILGAAEVVAKDGNFAAFITSSQSVQIFYDTGDWREKRYLIGNQSWHSGPLGASGDSTGYVEIVGVYDPTHTAGFGQMIAVFSNHSDSIKFAQVASATSYSDFTWCDSIDSTHCAKALCVVNDRLVLFNTKGFTTGGVAIPRPTRVMWSARGNPRSFLITDGAGAEDLMEMHGEGQKAIRFRDFMLLFTETEIWRGTPTLDDYAFRFNLVIDKGCPFPRTVVATPNGVVFLGIDHEVYITDGVSVLPLGPIEGQGESRIQAHIRAEITLPHRAWALYNRTLKRYELYYSVSGSQEGFPTRAFFYDFATQTWWPQTFTHALSRGVAMLDYGVGTAASSTDSFSPNYFDSFGTAFRSSSTLTNDYANAIDVRWRAPGAKNATRKAHLKDVWIDADVDSASSGSLWLGSARSNSVFTAEKAIAFTTANDPIFVPVFTTDNAPSFELRISDGGRPRIASFSATLQDASKF